LLYYIYGDCIGRDIAGVGKIDLDFNVLLMILIVLYALCPIFDSQYCEF